MLKDLQKDTTNLELEFLQEYKSAITTEDDIKRFFSLLGVQFVLNKKEYLV